jgi:hypothetical protein
MFAGENSDLADFLPGFVSIPQFLGDGNHLHASFFENHRELDHFA